MKYLLNALKEHWQVYVGLFLGLIIGLLVGVGFVDWNALVKGVESKITDWIMAGCTFFVLIGTWKAASYAKKAAHQAQIQNNNAIVSKIDDLYKDLGKFVEESKGHTIEIIDISENIITSEENKYIRTSLDDSLKRFLGLGIDKRLDEYKYFIEYVIGYKRTNDIYSVINEINIIKDKFSYENDYYDSNNESVRCLKINENTIASSCKLKEYADKYSKLIDELLTKITDKYQELNGCS